MPKKHLFTTVDQKHLLGLLNEASSKFLIFRSITNSFFRRDERLYVRADRLLEDISDIRKELEAITPK